MHQSKNIKIKLITIINKDEQVSPRRKKVKRRYTTIIFNFGRPIVLDDLCKESAPRHPPFWRRRFLKVYHIWAWRPSWSMDRNYFSNLKSPLPRRRLHMKFEQHWPRDLRGEVVWNSQHFSHTNVWCSYECIGKHRKKSNVNVQPLFSQLW